MDSKRSRCAVPPLAILWTLVLASVTFAQPDRSSARDAPTFERRYIDASEYRGEGVLLADWPALSRLVAWSSGLETVVAEEDATVSDTLIIEFRARVDSLERDSLPAFLVGRRDSIRSAIFAIETALDVAEERLEAAPPEARPTGAEGVNAPDRQRTLVTGNTAVTVPAGVAVGDADSMPEAEIDAPGETYFDAVARALAGLDRLVHLMRAVDAPTTRPRATPGARLSPRRDPPPPGP